MYLVTNSVPKTGVREGNEGGTGSCLALVLIERFTSTHLRWSAYKEKRLFCFTVVLSLVHNPLVTLLEPVTEQMFTWWLGHYRERGAGWHLIVPVKGMCSMS